MSKKPTIQVESRFDESRRAWIYQVKGKLIGCQLSYDFLEEARDRISSEAPYVVVDLSGITLLNSTGIGIFAALYNVANENNGKVYLMGTSEASQRPLMTTHVWAFLEKCDTLDDLPGNLE